MARRSEPRFGMTSECRMTRSRLQFSGQIGFVLQIRKFVEDDNGNVGEYDRMEEERSLLPESDFGSKRHRNLVSQRLLEAGWVSHELFLDVAFCDAKLEIEQETKKKKQRMNINPEFCDIPTIILSVKKFLRWEEFALELSMQETPKAVPATKESIDALPKVRILADDSTEECMICMNQLKSSEVTCMPCAHLFHGDCIQKWLNINYQCPLCRFPMPTDANP